ncbi:GSCOCG00011239001-RA-CDS [Cotesia congregata]|nr:GSCOCG00011239001-RA-CDS [Cotesia congregata]
MLQQRALENDNLPNNIANQVFQRFPDAASFIRPPTARQHVHRQRRLSRPALPDDFGDLRELLEDFPPIDSTYQGHVEGADLSIGYIFGSDAMLERLSRSSEVHLDATFKSVPQHPRGSQLLIFHIRRMEVGILALFILCSHKSSDLYEAIFDWLLNRIPDIRQYWKAIVTDFEDALLFAIHSKMPWVERRGCWFHFARVS